METINGFIKKRKMKLKNVTNLLVKKCFSTCNYIKIIKNCLFYIF